MHLLYLSHNQFTGDIPAELGNFPSLLRLLLNGNQLTGEIPAGTDGQGDATGLARLTRLESLWLHDNQLTGEIPAALVMTSEPADGCGSFQTAPCMEDLRLYRNRLTGELPAELALLTNLVRLHVNCNTGLTGGVPAGLGDIATLTHLGINGTGLTLGADAKAKLATQVAAGVVQCAGAPAPAPTPAPAPAPARAPAPQPKLAAALSAAPDPVTVGQTITYTLTVTNTGQVPLTGVFWRSPELGVGRRAVGDGTLAVGAAAEATLSASGR